MSKIRSVVVAVALPVVALLAAFVGRADSLMQVYPRDIEETLLVLKQRRRLKEPQSLLPFFINPFSPPLLCDWHYSNGEPDTWKDDETWSQIATTRLDESNIGEVKPCESVCVDIAVFEPFVVEILPLIKVKVLLFTHRWTLPQLNRTLFTDYVRRHQSVWHWFAQNPVYVEDGTYSAFPYGLEPVSLSEFGDAFFEYHSGERSGRGRGRGGGGSGGIPRQNFKKGGSGSSSSSSSTTIENLYVSDTHPSRQRLVARQEERGEGQLDVRQYYERIASTRFLLSPHGDRPDCYRHWEAIGLGAMPIANIDRELYSPLFGEDMMYVDDTDTMLELLDGPSSVELLDSRYHAPQSHKVLTRYWTRKVDRERRRCSVATGSGNGAAVVDTAASSGGLQSNLNHNNHNNHNNNNNHHHHNNNHFLRTRPSSSVTALESP